VTFNRNLLQHNLELLEDLTVGEADDGVALVGEPLCASGIVGDLIGFGVGVAIDFDAEFCLGAIEVDDEMIDGMLATNLETIELSIAQT